MTPKKDEISRSKQAQYADTEDFEMEGFETINEPVRGILKKFSESDDLFVPICPQAYVVVLQDSSDPFTCAYSVHFSSIFPEFIYESCSRYPK